MADTTNIDRRKFLAGATKVAYAAPVITTISVKPSIASAGSSDFGKAGKPAKMGKPAKAGKVGKPAKSGKRGKPAKAGKTKGK